MVDDHIRGTYFNFNRIKTHGKGYIYIFKMLYLNVLLYINYYISFSDFW